MTDQKSKKSDEERISPYLRLPLRSFEQADKDRKSRRRPTPDAEERSSGFQMNRASRQMRSFARHLRTHETLRNKSAVAKTPTAFHVTDRLRPHLATLMGNSGYQAFLSRALALASVEVSWLRAVHVNADGTLAGLEACHEHLKPAEFIEGEVVLLAHLLGLLVAFIGQSLTLRLVGDIWPQISLDDLGFGNGGKE